MFNLFILLKKLMKKIVNLENIKNSLLQWNKILHILFINQLEKHLIFQKEHILLVLKMDKDIYIKENFLLINWDYLLIMLLMIEYNNILQLKMMLKQELLKESLLLLYLVI